MAAEAILERPLPEFLRMLYRWHDGVDGDDVAFFDNLRFLPLADGLATRAMLEELRARGDFADRDAAWWRAAWLPILANGDAYCVDLERGGSVVEFLHADDARRVSSAGSMT